MEYRLEIYRPGTCDGDSCIKAFAARASFFSTGCRRDEM